MIETISQEKGLEYIINYLKMVAKARGTKPKGLKWSPEEFLLEFGQSYPIGEKTFVGKRMTPKQCYKNVVMMQMAFPKWKYCEGYAMHLIPFHHAWLVDESGFVRDPTMTEASAYFGVCFDRKYVVQQIRRQKCYGVLDGMMNKELYFGNVKDWEAKP